MSKNTRRIAALEQDVATAKLLLAGSREKHVQEAAAAHRRHLAEIEKRNQRTIRTIEAGFIPVEALRSVIYDFTQHTDPERSDLTVNLMVSKHRPFSLAIAAAITTDDRTNA